MNGSLKLTRAWKCSCSFRRRLVRGRPVMLTMATRRPPWLRAWNRSAGRPSKTAWCGAAKGQTYFHFDLVWWDRAKLPQYAFAFLGHLFPTSSRSRQMRGAKSFDEPWGSP